MVTLGPWQVEEVIAIKTAEVLEIKITSDRARTTAVNLDGKVVTLRIQGGSSVLAKVYTAVNRTQTGSDIGFCDVTLDETFHTETGDFRAGVYVDPGTSKPVLYVPEWTLTFVDNLEQTPTPTPSPTPTPT